MDFGYVKNNTLLRDEADYNFMLKNLRVAKVFVDRHGEDTALSDLIKYVRAGDCIVTEDVSDAADSVGAFVELVMKLHHIGVKFVGRKQQIDTSNPVWTHVLNLLSGFEESTDSIIKGRRSRLIDSLDSYFISVQNKEITVDEVCKELGIGRSTYYRRWRQLYHKPERERHPELFDAYEEKVLLGEITVRDACKEMGIGITTYYRMRQEK